MSKRVIPVGLAQDVEATGGMPLWSAGAYTCNAYSDDSPLSAILWRDLRQAYRRYHADYITTSMFEARMSGVTYEEIMEQHNKLKGIDPITLRAARGRVERLRKRLLNDSQLGLITVVYEQCGGWAAVGDLLGI